MQKDDANKEPHERWVVDGASLMRAAPEHVRPAVEYARKTTQDTIDKAMAKMQEITGRSTTKPTDQHGT